MLCGVYIVLLLSCGCVVYTCCSCNRLNWGALDAWSSAPQLGLLQLSCTLLPSSPLAYPTDSTILLLTSYLPIKTLVSRQQSTSIIYTVLLLCVAVLCIHCVFVAYVQSFSLDPLEPHDIAKVSYNRIKNRFANIFPCELFPIALYMSCLHNESHSVVNNPSLFLYVVDHSRVTLKPVAGVEGSDYINACFINVWMDLIL